MEKFGFVGLPNAGKSSLYNALTGGSALAAPYAFATTDPNVGVAKVPDHRLQLLATMSQSRNVVHASVQFTDIGGLVEGASQGEGLGNQFLANIREVDAIVYVLRAFQDPDIPGDPDPLEQLRVLEIELTLADLETLEKQVAKKAKIARIDKTIEGEVNAIETAVELLSAGIPLYRSSLSKEELDFLESYFLLTAKPVLAIVNIGENQLANSEELTEPVSLELEEKADVISACIQLEAEAAELPLDEQADLLEGLGLGEGALPRFVKQAYHILGLRTFLTTGEKESRAWTFRDGSTAPEAAGRIHTDFQKGFIRAETINWELLLECGSWVEAREAGKIRVEGKDYIVQDGDVMEFRFNV
ncbi:MAG: redox-regulated ATPase YchF [Acidimicrobiaceae bacterium]|nr:redox-regulated ATPase YchF [Acidimicrobiaceae bacterium]|tara:strand:+ start:506 stop:1582 length:1077 start_codon:yes stop_codon:yes gene_type:complete